MMNTQAINSSINTESNLINVTDKALEQIKILLGKEESPETKGLRLGVVGGGCSGFSYKIEFSQKKEKDNIIHLDGVDIYVDLKSSIYLKGITLDFKDGLNGKGFVFVNPNATNTCGCGESFSV